MRTAEGRVVQPSAGALGSPPGPPARRALDRHCQQAEAGLMAEVRNPSEHEEPILCGGNRARAVGAIHHTHALFFPPRPSEPSGISCDGRTKRAS